MRSESKHPASCFSGPLSVQSLEGAHTPGGTTEKMSPSPLSRVHEGMCFLGVRVLDCDILLGQSPGCCKAGVEGPACLPSFLPSQPSLPSFPPRPA